MTEQTKPVVADGKNIQGLGTDPSPVNTSLPGMLRLIKKLMTGMSGDRQEGLRPKGPVVNDAVIGIYNKFDIDSLIAAAYWKAKCDVRLVLPSDSVMNFTSSEQLDFYFFGVMPLRPNASGHGNARKIWINADNAVPYEETVGNLITQNVMLSRGVLELTRYQFEKGKEADPLGIRLAWLLKRFNKSLLTDGQPFTKGDNLLSSKDLLFIYVNYRRAVEALNGGEPFEFCLPKTGDEEDFARFIKQIRHELSFNYRMQYIRHGRSNRYSYVPVTSINSESWVWMKRLLMLIHGKYFNNVVTHDGHMVDTMMEKPHAVFLNFDYRRADQF